MRGMSVKHSAWITRQSCGDGLKPGQDVSVWSGIRIRWSHGWARLGCNMAGAVAQGEQTGEPQLKSSSPGKEEKGLTEASSGSFFTAVLPSWPKALP